MTPDQMCCQTNLSNRPHYGRGLQLRVWLLRRDRWHPCSKLWEQCHWQAERRRQHGLPQTYCISSNTRARCGTCVRGVMVFRPTPCSSLQWHPSPGYFVGVYSADRLERVSCR